MLLQKIRAGLKWLAAGLVAGISLSVWWKRQPRPKWSGPTVLQGELKTPRPIPGTPAERDEELRRLKVIK